jgi:hypothetical protein
MPSSHDYADDPRNADILISMRQHPAGGSGNGAFTHVHRNDAKVRHGEQ